MKVHNFGISVLQYTVLGQLYAKSTKNIIKTHFETPKLDTTKKLVFEQKSRNEMKSVCF